MHKNFRDALWLGLALVLGAALALNGCSTMKKTWSTISGSRVEDEKEEKEMAQESVPPEAQQETVMIDGKPYVRSKNPYWLTYPNQPEYLYVEKGTEFVGLQQHLINSLARAVGRERAKTEGKAVPPDKIQELVRQEVERVLREQGLGGFVSKGKAEKSPYGGRAVAVIPDLETPKSFEGLNRNLATGLAESLRRQKDISVSGDDRVREALAKVRPVGKMSSGATIQALGDQLGVQGVVLTGVVPPDKGSPGYLAVEVYDTFTGTKSQSVVAPAEGGLKPEAATKFVQQNGLRVAGELVNLEWFGRVEFVKEGKVYLSLGQNVGLKVGDRLKVVTPGKEVVNPSTHTVLGYTADVPQGELKVTELLGTTGAVALAVSGGPFKANDKVKVR